MPNRLTRGKALVGALHIDAQDITIADDLIVGDDATVTGDLITGTARVGGGTVIKKITAATVSVDPGSISATSTGAVTITVTGAAAGDIVVFQPPALNDDLVFSGANVTAANTVTLYIYNPTGDAIDDTAKTWTYLWIDAT